MNHCSRNLLAVCMVLALLFVPFQSVAQAKNDWALLPEPMAQRYIETVRTLHDYQSFTSVLLDEKAILNRAVALSRDDQILVVIPFLYENDPRGAAFSATIDKNTDIILATAGWATENTGSLHRVQIWLDGSQVADLEINDEQTVVRGWRLRDGAREQLANYRNENSAESVISLLQLEGFQVQTYDVEKRSESSSTSGLCLSSLGVQTAYADYVSCVNSCLANAGIPSYIIAAISIACIPICVITVGAGCIACATLAGAALVGTVTGCLVGCWGR